MGHWYIEAKPVATGRAKGVHFVALKGLAAATTPLDSVCNVFCNEPPETDGVESLSGVYLNSKFKGKQSKGKSMVSKLAMFKESDKANLLHKSNTQTPKSKNDRTMQGQTQKRIM